MERRFLYAIFLSFLVLYVYQALVVKPAPKPTGATTTESAGSSLSVGSATPRAGSSLQGSAAGASPPAATALVPDHAAPNLPAAAPITGATNEREVRVETRDVIAVFTNRGARLKSWRLKHYLDERKEPLELVAGELAGTQPLPFSLRVADERSTATLNAALYAVTGEPTDARASGTAPTELTFAYEDRAGLKAVKVFRLQPSSYLLDFRVRVSEDGRAIDPIVQWGAAVGDAGSENSRYVQKPEGLLASDGKVQRVSASNLLKQPSYDGTFQYAGVDDHYFMTVVLSPGPTKVSYQPISIPPPPGSKDPARDLVAYAVQSLPPGASAPATAAGAASTAGGAPQAPAGSGLRFFFGPKDFDVLASIDRDFVRAINFGIFAFLVVPLLRSLKWINGYVSNYGWSIIILTVVINAIMFPLRQKSAVSIRKMQEIQPEVKAIQDRYAKLKTTDPARQKMNTELMDLYRARGVNPASGCLPMLLTLPVLYAFYALLSTAIELRGAPFFGWIHDLSQHDPLYITPVLMGSTQLWQQKIMPATGGDPAQQKMMMVMPLVFTFLFLAAPAGLAIYWLVNNLWMIGQQYLTNYLIGPPTIRAVRPAAERRVKRVGGTKPETAAE